MDYVLGIAITFVLGFAAGGYFTPRVRDWFDRTLG